MENLYCRFCADLKNSDGLLNLECDEKKCNEILLKLSFLNATYVNVLHHSSLPKTMCLVCYDSLNKAYEFLDRVKRAQDVLSNLFPDSTKFDLSDDDRAALDDFLADNDDLPQVKEENVSSTSLRQPGALNFEVKVEPKEENDPTNILQDAINNMQYMSEPHSHLNVQDIIDAALIKAPRANVKVFPKEVTESDRKVTSWKEFPWLCAFCNIEFTDVSILRSHSKVAHNKCAAFSCIDCKTYAKNDDFSWFIKHAKKHRKNLRDYCHFCDEKIDSTALKAHIKQHLPKSQPHCRSCGETFPNEDTLHQHLQDFNSKPKRKPRRKAGTPITVEDLTCQLCKKVYKNPNSLRDHLKRHASDRNRNYTCDRCGKTFYSKGTLTSHVMAHDQIRPHICRICNKSFLFPNMLRRHVEMHSGVKPFSCEVCGRGFRLQYQLNAHKIVHTDSMPHVCQYCNKAFRFKQILKNHERQHTGAKPYSCEHCCMEFSNWSNYNKHMKRRHNVDTSKKKITPEGVFPINPHTGQIIHEEVQDMEEWKSKIMIPAKRGKKKTIKEESSQENT